MRGVALQKAVDELQRKGICRIPRRARCFSIRKASGWISKEQRNSLASRFGEGIDDQEEREAILDAWHRLGLGDPRSFPVQNALLHRTHLRAVGRLLTEMEKEKGQLSNLLKAERERLVAALRDTTTKLNKCAKAATQNGERAASLAASAQNLASLLRQVYALKWTGIVLVMALAGLVGFLIGRFL
jgi:hypothetical protein